MSTLAFAARPGLKQLCAAVLAGLVVALAAPAARAETPQTSAEFFEKYNPGQQAYQKKDYATALKSATEARKVAKSPFEKQAALKLMMGSAVALRNYPEAIEAIEALIGTEGVPANEKLGYYKTLAQLQGATNHFDKAIYDYNEYLKSGAGTPADYAALAQYYFAAKDCPKSLQALDKALVGGRQPDEDQLKVQMNCYLQMKQDDKMQAAAEEALKRFPKKVYFTQVLRAMQEKKADDLALAEVLRLGFDRDWLEIEGDYVKLADVALDVGTTAEAQRVLEKGIQKKQVKNADKVERLLKQAKERAAEDAKNIGQMDAEARAGKNGEADVRLGYRYYSMGQFDKAVEALQRGLGPERMARVKRPDDANMVLGISYIKLKKKPEADKAFNAAKADARMATAAKVWLNAI
jgi:tetratricopeptide (TPR) repeat protein